MRTLVTKGVRVRNWPPLKVPTLETISPQRSVTLATTREGFCRAERWQ
jgi:hypothetical protein